MIMIVALPPLERYLNWVHETAHPPSRDHGKENLPPPEEPRKLPRKMKPRRIQGKHHCHHLSQTGMVWYEGDRIEGEIRGDYIRVRRMKKENLSIGEEKKNGANPSAVCYMNFNLDVQIVSS